MSGGELAISGGGRVVQADTDAQVVALWLHGKSANTRRAYGREARQFMAFTGKTLPTTTLGDMQAYADDLESRLSQSSRVRALAAIKSLLSFAHLIGYLPVNVGAAEKLPAVKDTLAERIVSLDVVALVIAGERSARNRTLLRVLYYSGLRASEVCGLRWRDVASRDGGAVQVTVQGKGGKTRAVVLPAHVAAELLALRGEARGDDPVFLGRGGALTSGQVWRIVKAAGARAGVPDMSPHWLRHACASHALERGATTALVRDTLGHASLATTSRYLHARPGDSAGLYLPTV